MIALEILGGILLSAPVVWLAIRFLVARPARRGGGRGWALVVLGAFNTVTFLTLFVLFRSGAQRLGTFPPRAENPIEASAPSVAMRADLQTNPEATPLILPQDTPAAVAPAEQLAAEAERQDRSRGYHAGYALATDWRHQGSKVPQTWVLDAIVNLRSRGQGPGFADGFRKGYVTGLARQESDRPKG